MMEFSKPVERFLVDYCKSLEVDRQTFIENELTDLMARLTVMEESGRPLNLLQFVRGDGDKVMRGHDLFTFLVSYYKGEIGLADTLEGEVSRRADEAKQRLADYDQLQMEIQRGRAPVEYKGSPAQALRWLGQLDAGLISEEQLRQRWMEHARSAGWQSADDGEG